VALTAAACDFGSAAALAAEKRGSSRKRHGLNASSRNGGGSMQMTISAPRLWPYSLCCTSPLTKSS
jgi:hypothetical protein